MFSYYKENNILIENASRNSSEEDKLTGARESFETEAEIKNVVAEGQQRLSQRNYNSCLIEA